MPNSPVIHFWGAKGGVGTSTVAAIVATHLARIGPVELAGATTNQSDDLRAILGMPAGDEAILLGGQAGGARGGDPVLIVDSGTDPKLPPGTVASWLVTRPCYLALRRAVAAPTRANGVVLLTEPGRSLQQRDVEEVLGLPVVATIPVDAAIARVIDAGLMAARPPRLRLDPLLACLAE